MRMPWQAGPSVLERLSSETTLARRELRQGRFERTMAVVTALSATVSGFEAYVQHQRGAFDSRLMWTPVGLAPAVTLAATAALFSHRAAHRLMPLLSLATIANGAIGFGYHLRGIQRLPGGFRAGQYNIVMGPPVFAPLLMCSVGVAGLLSGLLRRETLDRVLLQNDQPVRLSQYSHLLARSESRIAHGQFQQLMAVTAAFFAVLAGGEAYFEHLRGSFNQRVMWTPVWATPPMVAAAAGAVVSERVARRVLPVASAVTFADGLLGFGLHLRGIQRMPGGFANLRFNLTMGPPLFAPLLLTSVGLLGFIASLLRRKGA